MIGDVGSGGRRVRLALTGIPFGWTGPAVHAQVREAWRVLLTG